MTSVDIAKGIGGLLFTGLILIVLTFINFVLRKNHAAPFGAVIPVEHIHAVLGPLLVIINSVLLVFLCALLKAETNSEEISQIQNHQVKWILGPILNPYYHGSSAFLNALGYGFLIVLWWLGMHSFIYSLGLSDDSAWKFGWQSLISVLYLAVGLASMLAIQSVWNKWGMDTYRLKWMFGFVGIGIGCFLPPLILRLGAPKLG